MPPAVTQRLSGWGRFPVQECRVFRPEKVAEVGEVFASAPAGGVISRGLGRAYGDAALNEGGAVVSHLRLNRMLGFDAESGVLECEAGVSLGEIVDVLLPRGWFLPVTPGTRHVTVGGAIASDVHGKNHHRDGTFGRFVTRLRLLTPALGIVECAPDERANLFWATVGGMGLTGAILSASFRLLPVESAYVSVEETRTADLDAVLARFDEGDADHRYSVAWIDTLARGRSLARGVLMQGDHAPAASVRAAGKEPLQVAPRRARRVPITPPSATLNRWSVGAFNAAYRAAHPDRQRLTTADAFFYPLDALADWNRMYGARGFLQYQAVLPLDQRAALVRLMERIAGSGHASFLAVLKRMGPAGQGMLSFPLTGWTLALDFPAVSGIVPFLADLDRIVLDGGGRVYLAKDATLSPDAFRAMYPHADEFLRVKEQVDPDGVLSSSLARRVGLVA